MLSVCYQNLPANWRGFLSLFVLVFICNTSVHADFGHHNSELEQSYSVDALPENLEKIPLQQLVALKKARYSKLRLLNPKAKALAISENDLLDSLIAYDNIRLKIADVIKRLIDEYHVSGSYKKKLLGYCRTFNTQIKNAQGKVKSLAEYKVYGTHFALAYVSLIYTFKENPEFFAQYQRDIGNTESTLGVYVSELNSSYREVEQARRDYDAILAAQQIERSITKLDHEIVKRRMKLIAQYHTK